MLDLDLAPDLPVISGNTNQILQAILNLTRNARQVVSDLPRDRRRIRIMARRSADTISIDVIDRGPGIPPDVRSKLFEPFFTTKKPGEGTGLGLTVVQSVVEGHGGRVEVLESAGGGATFRIVLPIATPEPPSEPAGSKRKSARSFPPGTRLLLADDEPVVRMVLSKMCEDEGIAVTQAGDADEAIHELSIGSFELVLLDVRMPGGGGTRVFEVIQDLYPSLMRRTIMMTGAVDQTMRKVVGGGYASLLAKPFSLSELRETLAETLTNADG